MRREEQKTYFDNDRAAIIIPRRPHARYHYRQIDSDHMPIRRTLDIEVINSTRNNAASLFP